MPEAVTRDLDRYWPELRARLQESFTLFEAATIEWGNCPVALWPDPDDVEGFLALAAIAGVRVVYARVIEFDESSLAGLERSTARRRGPDPDVADVLVEARPGVGRGGLAPRGLSPDEERRGAR